MMTVATCPHEQVGFDGPADCREPLPLPAFERRALAAAVNRVRLFAAIVLHVVWRLARWRKPSLSTFLLPSRSGGPEGEPMCWTDPGGALAGAVDAAATCNDLRVVTMRGPLRVPMLVVVERALAAGWIARQTVSMQVA